MPLIVPEPAAHTPSSEDTWEPEHVGQNSPELIDAPSENHHVPEYEYVEPPLVVTLHETASPYVLA